MVSNNTLRLTAFSIILALFPSIVCAQYKPVCLDAATQSQISTATGALAGSLGLDLTDAMLRLADQRCDLAKTTVGMLADIANLKLEIASIPAGPQGIQGATGATGAIGATGMQGPAGTPAFTPYAVPTNYVLPVITAHIAGGCLMSAGKCTGWTAIVNGGLYGQELKFGGTSGDSGTFYDYDLEVPQGGLYNLSFNAAVTSGTGGFTVHFECPIGTSLGSVSYSNAATLSNNPVILRLASAANLPAGSQRLRFVVDAAPAGNVGMVNWFYFTKQ